jgi:hypothetical protein
VAALPHSVFAQEWAKTRLDASPRHREYVTLKHDGRSVQAFVVYPEVNRKTPVIVLIHEIFGLSDWAKEMADELAAAGYIVIAPDLLSGTGPGGGGTDSYSGMDAITKAVSGLDPNTVNADWMLPQTTASDFRPRTELSSAWVSAGEAASRSPSRRTARTWQRRSSSTALRLRSSQRSRRLYTAFTQAMMRASERPCLPLPPE